MLKDHSPITQALLGTLFTWALTAAGAALVVVIRGKQVSTERRILPGDRVPLSRSPLRPSPTRRVRAWSVGRNLTLKAHPPDARDPYISNANVGTVFNYTPYTPPSRTRVFKLHFLHLCFPSLCTRFENGKYIEGNVRNNKCVHLICLLCSCAENLGS